MGHLFQYRRQVVRWESGRREGGVGWEAGTREGKSVSGRATRGDFTRVPFLRATVNADWRLADGNPGWRE